MLVRLARQSSVARAQTRPLASSIIRLRAFQSPPFLKASSIRLHEGSHKQSGDKSRGFHSIPPRNSGALDSSSFSNRALLAVAAGSVAAATAVLSAEAENSDDATPIASLKLTSSDAPSPATSAVDTEPDTPTSLPKNVTNQELETMTNEAVELGLEILAGSAVAAASALAVAAAFGPWMALAPFATNPLAVDLVRCFSALFALLTPKSKVAFFGAQAAVGAIFISPYLTTTGVFAGGLLALAATAQLLLVRSGALRLLRNGFPIGRMFWGTLGGVAAFESALVLRLLPFSEKLSLGLMLFGMNVAVVAFAMYLEVSLLYELMMSVKERRNAAQATKPVAVYTGPPPVEKHQFRSYFSLIQAAFYCSLAGMYGLLVMK